MFHLLKFEIGIIEDEKIQNWGNLWQLQTMSATHLIFCTEGFPKPSFGNTVLIVLPEQ